MTRFRFPLQPVLDLCEREERRLHEALLAAWRTHARDRERAQQLRAERVRLGRSLSVPAHAAGAGARVCDGSGLDAAGTAAPTCVRPSS